MTQIGVGIGGNKSPAKAPVDKQNHRHRKVDSTTGDDFDDEDPQTLLTHSVINTQNSSNSSEQRRTGGADDDNSNSFESHSDFDLNHSNDKPTGPANNTTEKSSRPKNRRGMSVNWGSSSTAAIGSNAAAAPSANRRPRANRGALNQKTGSNVKFFATSMAQSLYRNPIRLSGLTSTSKSKGANVSPNKTSSNPSVPVILTPIPSEPEPSACRVYPPPQPRPESLAIMSDELFHERLKARHSPLFSAPNVNPPEASLTVNNNLSTNFPSTSSFLLDKHCMEDVTYSTTNQSQTINDHQITVNRASTPSSASSSSPSSSSSSSLLSELQKTTTTENPNNLIELVSDHDEDEETEAPTLTQQPESPKQPTEPSPIKPISHSNGESSDESWRFLNSNSSLDEQIPYIDETDFEDLGKSQN